MKDHKEHCEKCYIKEAKDEPCACLCHSTTAEKGDRNEATAVFAPDADKGATVYAIASTKNIPHQKLVDFFLEQGADVDIKSFGNAQFDVAPTTGNDWEKRFDTEFQPKYGTQIIEAYAKSLKSFLLKELTGKEIEYLRRMEKVVEANFKAIEQAREGINDDKQSIIKLTEKKV